MEIQITDIDVHYSGNEVDYVVISFFGRKADDMQFNGTLRLAADEYAGNEAISSLESLVRQHLATPKVEDSPVPGETVVEETAEDGTTEPAETTDEIEV